MARLARVSSMDPNEIEAEEDMDGDEHQDIERIDHVTDEADYLHDILNVLIAIRDILTDMRDDHSTIDVKVVKS